MALAEALRIEIFPGGKCVARGLQQSEFVEGFANFVCGGIVTFVGLGGDGDLAGRAAVNPFELNFYAARGVAVFEFDIGVQDLLAVFHFDEFCFGLLRLAGVEGAGERRVGIEAIHPIEDEKIFAGADVVEFKFAVLPLKTPQAGLRIVETLGSIEFDGSELEGFSVGAEDAAANFSGGQGVDVVFVAGAGGNFEGGQAAFQGFLRELEARGEVGGVNIFTAVHVVEGIDAVGPGAGGETIVFGAQFQFYVWYGVLGIVGGSEERRIGAAQDAENGSDAIVIAHGAQLRQQRAAFARGARLAADDGEEAAFGFLLSEDDVLLAFFEIVAAVGVVAAGEDVNLRGVGAGEFFVNVEVVADDGRGGLRSDARISFVGVGRGGGGFGGRGIGRDGGDFSDGTEENDIVGLQAGTFSRRLFGTGAGPQA